MPLPLIAAGVGAGLGLLQNYQKRQQQKDQTKANAALAAISPWNSVYANMMQKAEPSPGIGGIIGGAARGVQMGGALNQFGADSLFQAPAVEAAAPESTGFFDNGTYSEAVAEAPLNPKSQNLYGGKPSLFARKQASPWSVMGPTEAAKSPWSVMGR